MNNRVVTICRRDDKSCFPTERDAWRQIATMREAGLFEARLLRAYRCVTHRGYHIGRLV